MNLMFDDEKTEDQAGLVKLRHSRLVRAALALAVIAVIAVAVVWILKGSPTNGNTTYTLHASATVANYSTTTTTFDPDELQRMLDKLLSDQYAAEALGFAPGTSLGTIKIPSIGVEVTLVQGTRLRGKGILRDPAMDFAPAHWLATPMPGQGSNTVISGHRVTYTRPFRDMDQVQLGDEIILELEYATVVYRVTSITIVPEAESGGKGVVVYDHGTEEITLQTCHPKGSSAYRMVVQSNYVVSFELNRDWLKRIWAKAIARITEEGN